MACLTSLDQNLDGTWKGVDLRTGTVKKFNTLVDYERYTKALQAAGTYCPDIDPQYTEHRKPGQITTEAGFMEFQVRDPEKQAKYSAMSPTWEGVASSEAAVARGEYSLDSAEATRRELRAQQPQKPMFVPKPEPAGHNCVVQ